MPRSLSFSLTFSDERTPILQQRLIPRVDETCSINSAIDRRRSTRRGCCGCFRNGERFPLRYIVYRLLNFEAKASTPLTPGRSDASSEECLRIASRVIEVSILVLVFGNVLEVVISPMSIKDTTHPIVPYFVSISAGVFTLEYALRIWCSVEGAVTSTKGRLWWAVQVSSCVCTCMTLAVM